jgi:hypothetical protein
MSDFAPEYWPVEADAVAGNVDYDDDYVDSYYDDSLSGEPVEIDPSDPQFQEAARQYALENTQGVIEQLIGEHLAPLGAQMEAALEEQQLAAGQAQADGILEAAGLDEAGRDQAFGIADAFVNTYAQELGVQPDVWIGLLAEYRGVSVPEAAQMILEETANVVQHQDRMAGAKDEFGVLDRYFQPITPVHSNAPGHSPVQGSNEFDVLRKYFPDAPNA